MKVSDITAILMKYSVAFQNFEVTLPVAQIWHELFESETAEKLNAALKIAVKSCGDFFPSPTTVNEILMRFRRSDLPDTLNWTASEALINSQEKKALCIDAREFADKVCPKISGGTQFANPGDMQRNVSIQNATWSKEFKQRFTSKQAEALQLVAQGLSPQRAILRVLPNDLTLKLGYSKDKVQGYLRWKETGQRPARKVSIPAPKMQSEAEALAEIMNF